MQHAGPGVCALESSSLALCFCCLSGEIENQLNALNVPCSIFPDSQECTTAVPDNGGGGFDPLQLVRSVSGHSYYEVHVTILCCLTSVWNVVGWYNCCHHLWWTFGI